MMTDLERELLQALESVENITGDERIRNILARNQNESVLLQLHGIAEQAIAKARGQLDECSHGVRRDLCPDCSDAFALCAQCTEPTSCTSWQSCERNNTCAEVPPGHHSHNASCYMLGQRTVSYRTCGKLEGEPS